MRFHQHDYTMLFSNIVARRKYSPYKGDLGTVRTQEAGYLSKIPRDTLLSGNNSNKSME